MIAWSFKLEFKQVDLGERVEVTWSDAWSGPVPWITPKWLTDTVEANLGGQWWIEDSGSSTDGGIGWARLRRKEGT